MLSRGRTGKKSWSPPCWPRSWRSSATRSDSRPRRSGGAELCCRAALPPRRVLDPDRRPHKSERLLDLVLQKTLVRKVQLHRPVRKPNEGRRRHAGLGHVEDLHPLAHRDRRALEVHRLQEAIHFAGPDPLVALARDLLEQRKNPADVLSRIRRDEQHRRIVQELQRPSQPLQIHVLVIGALLVLNARRARLADGPLLAG